MVSFVCESCQATLKKAKVAQHAYGCGSHYYSCIDCGDNFDLETIKAHNSCISEAQKHQGSMYRGPKDAKQNPRPAPGQKQAAAAPAVGANGKRVRHHLDSTDDEEEEAAAAAAPAVSAKAKEPEQKPSKKAKTEAAAPPAAAAAAAVPAAAATPAAAAASPFDALSSARSALAAKSNSLSLKKLRKAVVKAASASGVSKSDATTALMDALLANAQHVTISWNEADSE